MIAIGLIFGALTAEHYEDAVAADPRIDALRAKMDVPSKMHAYTRDYLDPDKRSIANAVQVFFDDGTSTERIEVEYPIGHRRRRGEGIPLLIRKFERAMATKFASERVTGIGALCLDRNRLESMRANEFIALTVILATDC